MTTERLDPIRSSWDALASGYDEFVTPSHLSLADESLEQVGLKPGDRFLDVAAGSGAVSIPAARLGARVLATDISPTMIGALEARARAEGLHDVEARVMDGHHLDLEDDTFDVAGSQFGVMLFPDLPRGLREMARVTRPGGRVLLTAYGAPAEVEFLTFFLGAMRSTIEGFVGLPKDPPPLPFQVANPKKLEAALVAAGLGDVTVIPTTERLKFSSAQHMWDWIVNSNPIGAGLVAGLSEEEGAEVRRVLDGMLRERSQGNGPAVLNNPVHFGIGVK